MSEILKLEDKANTNLKKLSNLLDNLSFNLSKEKTEKALTDGYECIKEIEEIIEQIDKIYQEDNSQNNLFMIKGDLKQKKEKYEKIRKTYILNKNNELIDSLSSTNIQEENNNSIEMPEQNITNLEEKIIYNNLEQNILKGGINNSDEIFNINKDMTEFSEDYIYSDNIIYRAKRKINKTFSKIKNKIKSIPPKTKYLILIVILVFLLIFCFFGFFGELFNS